VTLLGKDKCANELLGKLMTQNLVLQQLLKERGEVKK
jgi:hypothetical protein